MYRWPRVLVLIAAGSIVAPVPAVAQPLPKAALSGLSTAGMTGSDSALILVGGMTGEGMTGGGMTGGGMTGGGMTGGGMTAGGMTGGGMTGVPAGITGYGGAPDNGSLAGSAGGGQSYGSNGMSGARTRRAKIYHCVTRNGRCTVDSALSALRIGASCGCLLGGRGKIQ